MLKKFTSPSFTDKELELRFENNEVCIYGTSLGLKTLSKICLELIKNPEMGHIHMEDYNILTDASLKGTIGIFDKE